jgi:hypothetical protein
MTPRHRKVAAMPSSHFFRTPETPPGPLAAKASPALFYDAASQPRWLDLVFNFGI